MTLSVPETTHTMASKPAKLYRFKLLFKRPLFSISIVTPRGMPVDQLGC